MMATEQEKTIMNEASAAMQAAGVTIDGLLKMNAELNATIERLRSELEAEQARTICAMCGGELTTMAQPGRIEPQPIADVCETWWFGDKYFLNDELLIAHLGQLGDGTPCLIDGVWRWKV